MSPGTYNREPPSASGSSHILCRSGAAILFPAMSRAALQSVALLIAAIVVAGCSGDDETTGTTTGAGSGTGTTVAAPTNSKITLRASSTNAGPWVKSLSLEHGPDGEPTAFFVCAAWDPDRARKGCEAAPGAELPEGTILRLEQSPLGAAIEGRDSPGWATVGTSETAELEVPLSDFVAGLEIKKATYRVTLRPFDGGPPLATSNPITVAWS
jgi:hypothetical protein